MVWEFVKTFHTPPAAQNDDMDFAQLSGSGQIKLSSTPTTSSRPFFLAHVSPQLIGLDPLDFLRLGGGQRPACHRFEHPIHHRIVAHSHEPLGRPQPHPLKIVGQRSGALRGLHSPMIPCPAGLAAPSAQPALPAMSAAPVLHHFLTFTRLAYASPVDSGISPHPAIFPVTWREVFAMTPFPKHC